MALDCVKLARRLALALGTHVSLSFNTTIQVPFFKTAQLHEVTVLRSIMITASVYFV